MSSGPAISNRPRLQPSILGKYVGLDTCQQYFKFHIQEQGVDDLQHEKPHFVEAFRGGNIIEKKAGNEFEASVIDVIKQRVTEFYNGEKLTLGMVAAAMPSELQDAVPAPAREVSLPDIRAGDFTYFGVHASEINLNDAEGFIEEAEHPFDEELDENAIESGFFQLRAVYTEKLLGELIQNVDNRPAHPRLDFPTPQDDTGVADPDEPEPRSGDDPIVVFQPTFATQIGAWEISGDADIILIWPTDDENIARVRVIDVKLASEEQANHQIQTVTYSRAIEKLDTVDPSEIRLETGVLTTHDDYLPLTPEGTPEFDRESRETDLHRLTKYGGVLDTVYAQDYADTSYQLDSKCSSCQYNEVCYTIAIEEAGLELLGVNRGVQRTLETHGIEDLNDLAALARPVDGECHPDKTEKPKKIKDETYDSLATIPGLGERLPQLIQQAQALLHELNPDHQRVEKTRNAQHLTNTGYGDIPSDSWPPSMNDGYREGSMVRVYLNVQRDHVRDAISAIGFHVRATASNTDPISDAVFDADMPEDPVTAHEKEVALIEEFAEKLFDAIERVGRGIILDGYDQDDPFLHFFTYTEEEKRILEERLAMYSAKDVTITPQSATAGIAPNPAAIDNGDGLDVEVSDSVKALRTLLGHRDGPDQDMVTAVAPDIDARVAVRRPTTGLVNIYTDFFPSFRKEERFRMTDWEYTPSNPTRLADGETTVDLTDVFGYRFFNNRVQYVRDGDSIRLLHDPSSDEDPDGWYESRVRSGAQIPLPYLWGAAGKITDEWVEEAKESDADVVTTPYRYHDRDQQATEVAPEDVKALLERMCECLRHIEQGIKTRSIITGPGTKDTPEEGEEA